MQNKFYNLCNVQQRNYKKQNSLIFERYFIIISPEDMQRTYDDTDLISRI